MILEGDHPRVGDQWFEFTSRFSFDGLCRNDLREGIGKINCINAKITWIIQIQSFLIVLTLDRNIKYFITSVSDNFITFCTFCLLVFWTINFASWISVKNTHFKSSFYVTIHLKRWISNENEEFQLAFIPRDIIYQRKIQWKCSTPTTTPFPLLWHPPLRSCPFVIKSYTI